MLKVIYTETGQHLETLSKTAYDWLMTQRRLAHQVGHCLRTESCTAAILLPMSVSLVATLAELSAQEGCDRLSWAIADADYVEVVFRGTWISSSRDDAEGAFIAAVGDRTAETLMELWLQAQTCVSALSG